jgi:hypothetical protein
LLRCPAAYKLIEVAALSACGGLLKQQCQAALIELLEPVVPGDFFERSFAAIARKINTQDSDVAIASGVPHA